MLKNMIKHRLASSIVYCHRSLSVSAACLCLKPRTFTGEIPPYKELSESLQKKIDIDKERMQWRDPPLSHPLAFRSKLQAFNHDPSEIVPNTLSYMVKPIDFSINGVKNWFKRYHYKKEVFMQQFLPERHAVLGNDLAAAHFILFRKGKVRFVGQREWMEMDPEENTDVPLPVKFDPNFQVEAIKCDGMTLYYEGLENIRRLKRLLYLSFRGIETFDDWCMDRISGSEFSSLVELDVSNTKVTFNGLSALYRLPTLKKLIVTPPSDDNIEWKLTIAMLQEIMPDLEVVSSSEVK